MKNNKELEREKEIIESHKGIATCFGLGKGKCAYLSLQEGFTNLNQKESKTVYVCGTGQFYITREIKDLPISCRAFKVKDPLQIVSEK